MAGKQTIVAAVVPPADAKPVRKRKHVSASHQATIAAPVVPPQPKPKARAKAPSGQATMVATRRPAKTHAATIAAAVVPPARDLPSSRVTDVPAGAPKRTELASKPSQMNTMAAPVVPIESARPGRRALALQATMIATDAPDELADEIHIELSDSVIAKVPPEIRRETKVRVKAPTFDNLAVIAPRKWGWVYATSAAAAVLLVVLLLAIP